MNKNEILINFNEIIENYLNGRYDRLKAVERLITTIQPEEIYDIESSPLITDCYFAIKHLTEKDFETTNTELVYLRDCINGIREYSMEEKNKLILHEKHK
ncbi:hypothetical protein Q428_15080 [Fervidicella metallireducens AeB]|uniref:Uncharacterized protein n=1 Tax=Fervidicella metallireducens AeB TaxID=1403537 RepID=A0A017RRQ9_9CLOT|nr:hypothetical protein [Fervidicella metallireducens]EYE87134.1 hypothetical protein Q428_15080 [Fervidicella metallireducens AeB]